MVQFVTVGPAGSSAPAERAGSSAEATWLHAEPGTVAGLASRGFEPDRPATFWCDNRAGQLTSDELATALSQLRSLATPGSRLALVLAPGAAGVTGVLTAARWRPVPVGEPAQQAGLHLLAPLWAPAGPGDPPTVSRIAQFTERMLYRSAAEDLPGHLEACYGVRVTSAKELDLGVHRVDLAGGASWIARVFPASRDAAAARQDAQLLAWLAEAGFPAERCARTEPVSVLDGQPVMVTQRAPGRAVAGKPESFEVLGGLLGQLHAMPEESLPEAARRPGGAWHHLLAQGTPGEEVAAARALLHDARHRVHAGEAGLYDALAADLEASGAFDDLPHALVHPDLAPANVVGGRDGPVAIIDWAGAGRGPRVTSLGCLLWSATGSAANVEAAIAGYRRHVIPDPAEADRVAEAMRLRPLILACWTFSTGRGKLADATAQWHQHRRRIDAAAGRARAALAEPALRGR